MKLTFGLAGIFEMSGECWSTDGEHGHCFKYQPWISHHKRLYISPAFRAKHGLDVYAIENAIRAKCSNVKPITEAKKDAAMTTARHQIANKGPHVNRDVWLCTKEEDRGACVGLRNVMNLPSFLREIGKCDPLLTVTGLGGS